MINSLAVIIRGYQLFLPIHTSDSTNNKLRTEDVLDLFPCLVYLCLEMICFPV